MAYCTCLENTHTFTGIVGSNPTLSASLETFMKRILFAILIILVLLGATLMLGNLLGEDLKDKAIAIGYFSAATYSLLFGLLLKKNLQKISTNFTDKKLLFTIYGSIGAIFLDTVVWWAQTALNTEEAAISPNLWIDLFMTVPFYVLLCYFLSGLVTKYKFSWVTIALTGGFYEIIADGIIGNLIGLNILGVLISPILFPIFIIVYSPIILVPFLLLPPNPDLAKNSVKKDFLALLKPVKAVLIFPFSIGLGLLLEKLF